MDEAARLEHIKKLDNERSLSVNKRAMLQVKAIREAQASGSVRNAFIVKLIRGEILDN
jgi:hypothetical protein